jgi:hypothetical protein
MINLIHYIMLLVFMIISLLVAKLKIFYFEKSKCSYIIGERKYKYKLLFT